MFRHSGMGLKDAVNVALHVLRETKRYVDTCGGSSELIVLRKDGTYSNIERSRLATGEAMSATFSDAIRRLFVVSADLAATDEQIAEEFDTARKVVNATREHLRIEQDGAVHLTESLSKLVTMQFLMGIIRS